MPKTPNPPAICPARSAQKPGLRRWNGPQTQRAPRRPLQRPSDQCTAPAKPSIAQAPRPGRFGFAKKIPALPQRPRHRPGRASPRARPPRARRPGCTTARAGNRPPSRCRPGRARPSSCRRPGRHRRSRRAAPAPRCRAPGSKTPVARPALAAPARGWRPRPGASRPRARPGSGRRRAPQKRHLRGPCKTRAPWRAQASSGAANRQATRALRCCIRWPLREKFA